MNRFITTTAALLIATTAAASPSPTCEVGWTPGEVAVRVQGGETAKGEVVGVVDVPMERVLEIVLDCDGNERWFPKAMKTTSGVGEDSVPTCSGLTDMPWPFADRSWTIEVVAFQDTVDDVDTWAIPFRYIGGGTVDEMYGGYHLQPYGPNGEQTLVTYEAWVDLGVWIPDPLLNWATGQILPKILTGIEAEAARTPRHLTALSAP